MLGAEVFLETRWEFLKYLLLAKNFFQEAVEKFQQHVVTLVAASVTS